MSRIDTTHRRETASIFSYLLADAQAKLRHAAFGSAVFSAPVARAIQERLDACRQELAQYKAETDVSEIIARRQTLGAHMHELLGLVGQMTVATHWQSPAVIQHGVDNRGKLPGRIIGHYNDYTRDQHVVGAAYEQRYKNAYIALPPLTPVFCYATVSGMAAITTAALFVLGETDKDSTVILGASCYFETKQLILSMFGSRVVEVDLSDKDACIAATSGKKIAAIFADTIGNEPAMRVVDIPQLLSVVNAQVSARVIIVVDGSTTAVPMRYARGIRMPKHILLIGVESQNKLLQYGADRVTGGVVWGTGYIAQKLYDYRDHAGTMCPDMMVASLPAPNARMAARYARLIQSNAKLLAQSLSGIVFDVVYRAGSPYIILSKRGTRGSKLNAIARRIMKLAAREKIALVEGTSFGFQTTRIYTVAMNTRYEKPFLRIAPGIESPDEMRAIARIVKHAVR